MDLTRRKFLQAGLAFTAAAAAPKAFASHQLTPYTFGGRSSVKELSFFQTHTGEKASFTFFDTGLNQDALAQANRILRDWRTDDVIEMDTELLFLLHDIKSRLGTEKPFHIISGYRSPRTNATLAAKSGGVAKNSYHMRGMAIDIRVPGIKTSAIRDAAMEMERGGVGYYRSSDFVHIDTGRVRSW